MKHVLYLSVIARFYHIPFILVLALFSSTTLAGDGRASWSVQFENDLFNGPGENYSDKYYTHGLRSSVTYREKRDDILQDLANQFPGMSSKCAAADRLYSISIGQNMFTPVKIWRSDLIEDDRPYAGWLYVNFGLLSDKRYIDDACLSEHKKHLKGLEKKLANSIDSLELSFGVVGPASQAEHVQSSFHDIMGGIEPRGWQHQLKNEPVVNLTYNRQVRFTSGDTEQGNWDIIPHAGFALGTVYTYANAGATVRVGHGLNADYGPPRIYPGIPGSDFIKPGQPDFSLYAFAGVEGRAVARNIFLDGNTFTDSHSVDKHPFVGDLQAGLVLRYKDVRLSFTNIFRSREFEHQEEGFKFGAATLTWAF